MARSRNIKPGFFVNEYLVELPFETRLLFAGLWTLADREGRLEDRPKKIKMAIFPADNVDINQSLQQLHDAGLIIRYVVGNKAYIEIRKFKQHQNPHIKEAASVIPAPGEHGADTRQATPLTSSLIPDSLTPPQSSGDVALEPDDRTLHVGLVFAGITTELGISKLTPGAARDWENHATLAFENGFTASDVIECFSLLRNQEWRTFAVKPSHVTDNLPELKKLRSEAKKSNGKDIKLPTLAERQAAEAAAKALPRNNPKDFLQGVSAKG